MVFDPTDPAEAAFVEEATRYYQVFDAASGQLLVQSDAMRPLGLEFSPPEVRQFRDQRHIFDVNTDYGRLRLSNSVLTPGNGHSYLLQVGVSLVPMDRALERFLFLLLIGVPAGLIVTFVIGRWMARFALTPLSRLAESTRTINIEDLGRRVPVRGARDELDNVATAFNDTLERLEHAIGEMRQFSTALAHELRTPLAALRGDIEMTMLQRTDEALAAALCQPTRGDRQTQAPDRSDPGGRAGRSRTRSRSQSMPSISERSRRRSSTRSSRWPSRKGSPCDAITQTTSSCKATRNGSSGSC